MKNIDFWSDLKRWSSPVAGGEGDGLDAVSAEDDQLRVGRLAVHDQQVQDRHRGAEDLQFLLQSK